MYTALRFYYEDFGEDYEMPKVATKQKQKPKVIATPVNADELARLHKHMPPGVRTDSAWLRQLALERLAQLEQANGSR